MNLIFREFIIVCIFLISQPSSIDSKLEESELLLNLRYKPIAQNINTKHLAKCSLTSNPLYVAGIASGKTFLVNTGQSVQTTNQIKEVGIATGGVLGHEVYKVVSFTYYWTGNKSSAVTGTTINGKGYPYEARLLNMNVKYENLTEAVKHEDGIFDFVFIFDICSIPNQPFADVSRLIQKIPKAGSFTPALIGTQILAIDFIPLNSLYYSYSGTVQDVFTGRKYKPSTVVVIQPNPQYCITQKQFDDTFGPLRNFQGKPFTNTMARDSSPIKATLCSVVTQTVFP